MPDSKKPVEQLLDLVVYAPLGLLLNLDEVVPELVAKGRQQVVMAKMFGRFAVQQGGEEARRRTAGLQEAAAAVVGQLGASGAGLRPPGPWSGRVATDDEPEPARSGTDATGTVDPGEAPVVAGTDAVPDPSAPAPTEERIDVVDEDAPAVVPPPPVERAPSADDLAVPGYDSLAASQVVPRLAGLGPDELDAVRRYETANRHRKTILAKIDQLRR